MYNRHKKENKMQNTIRKRKVEIKKKIKNEIVSISTEAPISFGDNF